jgi:hypothetical protein
MGYTTLTSGSLDQRVSGAGASPPPVAAEPFGCLVSVMSNGAGKTASRHELPVVAEDTAFASINGVPKSGASAPSLGGDYRRHQLVYKFDRKQISAKPRAFGTCPGNSSIRCSPATARDAGRGGSHPNSRLAAGVHVSVIRLSRSFVCNHSPWRWMWRAPAMC